MPQLDQVPALRARVLLIGLPMAGGAGLATYILAGISLPLAILVLALGGAGIWALVLRRTGKPVRRALRRRAVVGMVAGLTASVAYDAARYGLVSVFQMSFKPFHVFSLFGELFIGAGHGPTVTFLVGLAYHLSNGTFFGVAYTLVFRRPTWWTGTLWGVGLELCMATLYPQWLRIQVMHEFLEVSAFGHVVYGTVLGLVAAAGIRRLNRPAPAPDPAAPVATAAP
jgi:hypothetical protein